MIEAPRLDISATPGKVVLMGLLFHVDLADNKNLNQLESYTPLNPV